MQARLEVKSSGGNLQRACEDLGLLGPQSPK